MMISLAGGESRCAGEDGIFPQQVEPRACSCASRGPVFPCRALSMPTHAARALTHPPNIIAHGVCARVTSAQFLPPHAFLKARSHALESGDTMNAPLRHPWFCTLTTHSHAQTHARHRKQLAHTLGNGCPPVFGALIAPVPASRADFDWRGAVPTPRHARTCTREHPSCTPRVQH